MSLEQNSRIFDHSPDHKSKQTPIEPSITDIFKDVEATPEGQRQLELDSWEKGAFYLDQAPRYIEAVLRRQGAVAVDILKPSKDAKTWLKPRRQGFHDSPEDATTKLQEYLFELIPNCTWTRDKFKFHITRGVSRFNYGEGDVLIPRYVFTLSLNLAYGFRFIGEMVREFDVHAEYNEQSQTWEIHTDLVQSKNDIHSEKRVLLDEWDNKVKIGQKMEEGRLRHPFHGGLPGGGQKN